jgi:hypothetical protein
MLSNIDSEEWQNIQSPVKETLLYFSNLLATHSKSLATCERKCGTVSNEGLEGLIRDIIREKSPHFFESENLMSKV